jgi:hypothetical protein
MARSGKPFNVHVRFNERNTRQAEAAHILDTVPSKYKNAFLTLAIESYMTAHHPAGVNMEELMAIQKETDRSYTPKNPIMDNLARPKKQVPAMAVNTKPALPAEQDNDAVDDAIEKAMAMFGGK